MPAKFPPMTLEVHAVVSEGLSLVTSRNGALLAGLFLVAEALGFVLFLVAGTMYVPVDAGTGLTPGSDVPAGDLPAGAASVATMLTGLFNIVVTVPISIVAIRTFVGGATDRIPDAYLFRRIGRATLSGVLASLAGGFLLFAVPFVGTMLAIGVVLALSGVPRLLALVVLVGLVLAGTVAVWLHILFLLHEIAVRDRGVLGAFRGSWDTVRGNRVRLAALAGTLVIVRMSVAWYGVPPADGSWSLFQLVLTPVAIVLSALAGVVTAAILARAYLQCRPDVDPAGLAGRDEGYGPEVGPTRAHDREGA